MKVRKTYPPFYNGISEQSDLLILDTQCRDMVNCIPDIVKGLSRRNGMRYVNSINATNLDVFHTYNQATTGESYVFLKTDDSTNPIRIFDRNGIEKTLTYEDDTVKDYLFSGNKSLKALTVQDTTFITNKDVKVGYEQDLRPEANYKQYAYLWAKRSSNDPLHQYTYGIYIDGYRIWTSHHRADLAMFRLKELIDGVATVGNARSPSLTTGDGYVTVNNFGEPTDSTNEADTAFRQEGKDVGFPTDLTVEVVGNMLSITKSTDFTFSSWDSWGDQASYGWKGRVNKLSDLPKDMSEFSNIVHVAIGTEDDKSDDYFVKAQEGNWIETRDPEDLRDVFVNMPIKVERKANGTFLASNIDYETPNVGSVDTNPTPSFFNKSIVDIIFYKNRLGFLTDSSLVLSETGGYYNFYIKTVLDILDTDPIDITIGTKDASYLSNAVSFTEQIVLFSKNKQYKVTSQGALSPTTVELDEINSLSVDTMVDPVTMGDSIFFISRIGSQNSLREYRVVNDNTVLNGEDLSIVAPSLLPKLTKIVYLDSIKTLCMVSKEEPKTIYIFSYKESGGERVQSSWYKFVLPVNITTIFTFDNALYVLYNLQNKYYLGKINMIADTNHDKIDEVFIDSYTSYESYITLPKWLPPSSTGGRIEAQNIVMQKAIMRGQGSWDVDVTRSDYNTTNTKEFRVLDTTTGELIDSSTVDNDAHINGKANRITLKFKEANTTGTAVTYDDTITYSTVAWKHPTIDGGYKQTFDEEGNIISTELWGDPTPTAEQEQWIRAYDLEYKEGTHTMIEAREVTYQYELAFDENVTNFAMGTIAEATTDTVRKYWTNLILINEFGGGWTRWYDHTSTLVRDDRWGKWASQYTFGTIVSQSSVNGSGYPQGIGGVRDTYWDSATSSYIPTGVAYTVYPWTDVIEFKENSDYPAYIVAYSLGANTSEATRAYNELGYLPNIGITYKYDRNGNLLTVDPWNDYPYNPAVDLSVREFNEVVGTHVHVPQTKYSVTTTVQSKTAKVGYYSIVYVNPTRVAGETIWYNGYGEEVTDYIQPYIGADGTITYDPNGGHADQHKWGDALTGAWERYPAEEGTTTATKRVLDVYNSDYSLETEEWIGKVYTTDEGTLTEWYRDVVYTFDPTTGADWDFSGATLMRTVEEGGSTNPVFSNYVRQQVPKVTTGVFNSMIPVNRNEQFVISSITLEGLYRPRARDVK